MRAMKTIPPRGMRPTRLISRAPTAGLAGTPPSPKNFVVLDLKLPQRHTASERNPIINIDATDLKPGGNGVKVRERDDQIGPEVVRAEMESESLKRQSLRTAGKLPGELSASIGVG